MSTDEDKADVQKLFKAVANNAPGLLHEMYLLMLTRMRE